MTDKEAAPTRTGRHPDAQDVVIRLIDPAIDDLNKLDPQARRWALKKMLLLERDPEAGAPLRGSLAGFRKIVVGDRHWRIIWRVTHGQSGQVIVDVAEVWAVGARSEDEVYDEMRTRLATLRGQINTIPLAEALEGLGRLIEDFNAKPEPSLDQAEVPDWLVNVLTSVVGMPSAEVAKINHQEAAAIWTAYTNQPRPDR